jgi:hypothetical protein
MRTSIRLIVVALFLVTVLALAQNGTAWATFRGEDSSSQQGSLPAAPEAGSGKGGTVKPPPNHITITQAGTYSVGGCLVRVEYLAPGNTITVEYISRFHNERKLDTDHPRFRAGTCRITHYENGKKVDEVKDPENAIVYACFGAPLEPKGLVHEYSNDTKAWTHRNTTYDVYDPATGTWRTAQEGEPALTCGQANLSGYYLVASHQ